MKPHQWRRSSVGKYLRHLPRLKQLRGSWLHRALGDRLLAAHLWHFDRQGVALGLAVGGFFSQMPMPFQMVPAALIAMMLRANLPVAIAGCWITNPLTFAPFIYLQLLVGSILLGRQPPTAAYLGEMSWAELLRMAPVSLVVGGTLMGVVVAAFCHPAGGWLYDLVVRRIAIRQARKPRRPEGR